MKSFKEKGLVIKEKYINESDKIVTLLMKTYGKVTVYSKGARNIKSKFLTGTQLFSYSEFVILNGANFFSVLQIDLIESFYNIRTDYDKLCFSTYYLEFIDKLVLENSPCDEILFLVLNTLNATKKNNLNNILIFSIFTLKMLQLNGYTPNLKSCNKCNKQITNQFFFFQEGILCENCLNNVVNYFRITKTTLFALNYIFDSDIKKLYNFKVDNNILIELLKVSRLLVNFHLDIVFNTLNFIDFKL